MFIKFIFWFSICMIFYSYIGYGLLIGCLLKIRRRFAPDKQPLNEPFFEPEITLIVCAYNEAGCLEEKIRNSLELDYPADKLSLIFVTDGSDDGTPGIVRRHPRIRLLHQPDRRGKVAAMNRAVQHTRTPFLLFSDANALLNPACIREIVKHYADPATGGVAGEKKVFSPDADQAAGAGEGLYWKYESFLKKLDSAYYTVVGAAGELFSLRTGLYQPLEGSILLDDFVQSMLVCRNGYVIRYEPNAYATETASISMKEEQKRKIRISAGAFQAMGVLKALFNIFKYPRLSFQFISHRILRWTLCPLCLFLLLLSTVVLAQEPGHRFFTMVLAAQLLFYALAATGWMLASRNLRVKAFYVPYYFVFMNLSVWLGFFRFLRGRQPVIWEKSVRQAGL